MKIKYFIFDKVMAWMLRYAFVSVIILYAAVRSESLCTKKEKVSILLNLANEFISKAKDSHSHCSYSVYFSATESSSSLMYTASILTSAAKAELSAKESQYKLVCYFDSLAYTRNGNNKFDMSSFLPNLCTHAIYGIAKLQDNVIVSSDPSRDLPEGLDGYKTFTDLKLRNPNLQTLIGIGGWEAEGSAPWSYMAADSANRSAFIDSVKNFLDKYGFDGIDINWSYPANNGGRPEDKQNFVVLLRELKAALTPRGRLVTTTVSSAGSWDGLVIELAYDIPQIANALDQIHLLCLDFHGYWDDETGLNAPLYAPPDATDLDRLANVDFAINYWLERGMPKEKLIMALPFYGRMYTLENVTDNEIGAPASEVGNPGHINGNDEELGFNEVCDNLTKKKWASVWDSDSQTPYAYKDDQWVSYDDLRSINIKIDYLMKKGLAGALVKSIDTDDYRGRCYGKKYILLRSVASKLLS